MSEHTPFLNAIRDQPYDDAPRLIYADWLEEQGDRWADLIRLQCAMARELDRNEHLQLKRAAEELERQLPKPAWLPELDGIHWQSPRRGIIQAFSINGQVSYPDFVTAQQIGWEWVVVWAHHHRNYDIFAWERYRESFPEITNIRTLALFGEFQFRQLNWERPLYDLGGQLANIIRPQDLRELYLPASCATHFTYQDLSQLRTLAILRDSPFSIRNIALLNSPKLRNVDVLDLTNCGATDADVQSLVHTAVFRGLRALSLASCRIGRRSVELLAEHGADLELLDLRGMKLRDGPAEVLLESDSFSKLRHVGISSKNLSPATLSRFRERFGDERTLVDWPQRKFNFRNLHRGKTQIGLEFAWASVVRDRLTPSDAVR